MPTILALATLGMGLTVEEALTAATLNAAAALGRAAEIGSVEVGKRADLAVLRDPTHHHLVYHYGVNPVRHVVKNGRVVVRDGRRVRG
jgi:imidazolonepropionase